MVKQFYKKVKAAVFADPVLLYQEEIALVNQPFCFDGTNEKAVLLIHGWTTTPYELRRFGKYLNENGYTVFAPLLRGHGTVPKDLENVCWPDWLADIKKEYAALKEKHQKVFIVGTSVGASLAVMLAGEEKSADGLVLMAMPYKLKFEKSVVNFAKLLSFFKKYHRKYYPPTFGSSTTITRLISYQTYPIKSALESFELIKKARENLGKITQPCFIIQSASDHIVSKNSLNNIYEKINSKIKRKKYIRRAYHTFISDIKNDHVFEDILSFLNEN